MHLDSAILHILNLFKKKPNAPLKNIQGKFYVLDMKKYHRIIKFRQNPVSQF